MAWFRYCRISALLWCSWVALGQDVAPVRAGYSEGKVGSGRAAGQIDEAHLEGRRGLAISKELADRPNATHGRIYNYAWLVITADPPDPPDLQDPRGLPYALKVVEMGGRSDEYSLHVLGQANWGIRDYPHAIEAEEKALALFPPVAPGGVKPSMRKIVEREDCREHAEGLPGGDGEGRREVKRRAFLLSTVAAFAGAGERIVDTHIHLYDPERSQGVPWPAPPCEERCAALPSRVAR